MRLTTEDGVDVVAPAEEDVRKAVVNLNTEWPKFAILQEGRLFIQAAANEDGTYQLEYSEGSPDQMFVYNTASQQQTTEAFLRFLDSRDHRSTVPFKPIIW